MRRAPNPACSGHGSAVGEPWGWSGKNPLLAVVVGRHRRAADAIVGHRRIGLWQYTILIHG